MTLGKVTAKIDRWCTGVPTHPLHTTLDNGVLDTNELGEFCLKSHCVRVMYIQGRGRECGRVEWREME